MTLTVAVALPSVVFKVIVAERGVVTALVSAVTMRFESPLPPVEPSLTHESLEMAVHIVLELTEMDFVSESAVNVRPVGDAESMASAPICRTMTEIEVLLSLWNTMLPSRACVLMLISVLKVYMSTSSSVVLLVCHTQSGRDAIL